MPAFQYDGRNQHGEALSGRIEAASIDAVANQLLASGITPINIDEAVEKRKIWSQLNLKIGGDKVTLVDLIFFSRQMYTLLKAGVPIMQALRGLRDTTHNTALVKIIEDIYDSLDSGLELSVALRRHPKVFSTLYVSLIQVGEATGGLEDAFQQLAGYLDKEKDTRDRIKTAVRYPMFVISVMVLALFFINIFVIPAFAGIFSKFGADLPLPTQILLATSGFFIDYWYVVVAAIIAAVVGFHYYTREGDGRYRWDRYKLRLPVIGSILFRASLGRFARSLAMTITAGVSIVQAMTVVSRAVDNDYIGQNILQMRDGIESGESIARTAATTGMFPPMVLQMIAVGEESGSVDELLIEVAEFYEREVDYDIKNLSVAIEPILTVVLGVIVLVLALGVFLPMWDLASVMRR